MADLRSSLDLVHGLGSEPTGQADTPDGPDLLLCEDGSDGDVWRLVRR